MSGFAGKSIVVTGGGSGIGRAIVEALSAAGAFVTIGDINEDAGKETLAAVAKLGQGKAQFVRTDVSSEDSIRALVAAAVDKYGRLDGAANCAGIEPHGKPLHELTAAEWDRVMSVNLRGVFLATKHEIAAMLASGGGSIVSISSVTAVMGLSNMAEYVTTKAGITGLVRAAAGEYANAGIRVNALLPGVTDTPMVQRLSQRPSAANFTIPLNRMASSAEIAAGAVWLLSDQASYVTGHCLMADGGMSIV